MTSPSGDRVIPIVKEGRGWYRVASPKIKGFCYIFMKNTMSTVVSAHIR